MKEFKETSKKEEKMGITTPYSTIEEWEKVLEKYKKGESAETYQRDGYAELEEREKKTAELIGMKKDEVVIFNAGMAAIRESLELENLTKGDVVLYSPDLYSHSKDYIENELPKRGIKTIPVESGDIEKVEKAIDERKPKVIFMETVGNTPNMPVVNVDRLISKVEKTNKEYQEEHSFSKQLEKILRRKPWFSEDLIAKFEKAGRKMNKEHSYMSLRGLARRMESVYDRRTALLNTKSIIDTAWLAKREKPITLILDNTIPTSTNLKLAKKLEKTDAPVVIVESGTKFFAHDKGTLGLVYSKDKEKILELKLRRAETGTYLPSAVEELLPEWTKKEFEVRNKQVLQNTKFLAETLAKLIGKIGIETVSHPNLPNHPNYEYASKNMPDGASAMFYIKCKDSIETAKKLKEALGSKVEIGGSFGFEKTRLLPLFEGILRIAGGNEKPEEMIKILEAIEKLNKEK